MKPTAGELHGLDLFSGGGGGALALAPWCTPVAYCEVDPYPQAILLSRMATGLLPAAPIATDVRLLRGSLLPRVDLVYGGSPCQDISVAGRGGGVAGKRSALVFDLLRLVSECEPSLVFLENVPAIRTRGADVVVAELAALGFACRWDCLSAADVGAKHKRERWFLLAAHTERLLLWEQSGGVCWQSRKGAPQPPHLGEARPLAGPPAGIIEPRVGRAGDGLPYRMDRHRVMGNAWVPQQAREAFRRLLGL